MRPRALLPVLASLVACAVPGAATAATTSRITQLEPRGRQVLAGGYERVFGVAHGVVDGSETIRGLPSAGASYAVEYEIIRPVAGAEPRMLLVEAENRGSPLVLDALAGLEPGVSGSPSTATYPAGTARFLRDRRLAYARIQWQTGIANGVPATAQGIGEAIVRDFGGELAKSYPRRTLAGVSQGAFFVDTFIAEGFNALPGGGRAYDRALTIDGNGNWMAINRLAGSGAQDPYLRSDGRPFSYRKLLARPRTDPELYDVANYTDFYRLRAGLTDAGTPPSGVRRYDWASPHQSFSPDAVFNGFKCNGGKPVALNPLRNDPYLRALVDGIARGRPAPSRRFVLGRSPKTSPGFNGLPGVAVPVPKVDADGQPVGGVRFPELGSPLGALRPVSLSPSVTTSSAAVCGNSGGFAPFGSAAVARRYSKASYLARYRAAITTLEAGGYLLAADRQAMLRGAAAAYDAAVS